MKSKIAMAVLGAVLILPAVSFAADVGNGAVVKAQSAKAQSAKAMRQDNAQARLIQESNGVGGVGG